MKALTIWFAGLILILPMVASAENDGNNLRALETAVVSPTRECGDPSINSRYVPLLRGLHDRPSGYVDGSYLYLFTHSAYWPDNRGNSDRRDCHTELPKVNACNKLLTDSNPGNDGNSPQYIPELSILYRTPNTAAGMTAPYERLGYVGPCFTSNQLPGDELSHGTVAYVGRPANGRINNKYYFTVTRARGYNWSEGGFDELYLGAVLDPNSPQYTYHQRPILRMSNVNSVDYEFLEPMLAGWSTPGTKPFTQVQSPLGPAQMWGYIPFGPRTGFPSFWAGIQIADYCSGLGFNYTCLYVYLLAADGVWRNANRLSGSIDFVPQDLSSHMSGVVANSLFYNTKTGRWMVVGENPTSQGGEVGCSDDGTSFGSGRVTAIANLPPFNSSGAISYLSDNYTQNRWHQGGMLNDIGTTRYVLRASTENACFNRHWAWTDFGACTASNPGCSRTPGMEIVIETIPRD